MNWEALLKGTQEVVQVMATSLLVAVAVVLGVFFIWSGIQKMLAQSRGERQGQNTAGPVAVNFLIGSILLQLTWSVGVITQVMFGAGTKVENPNNAMSYMPEQVEGNVMLQQAINVGVLWIYCIGFVAIIRGFVQWNAMANGNGRGQDNGWKGFWHIFFGAMAVNITHMVRMLTSGGS